MASARQAFVSSALSGETTAGTSNLGGGRHEKCLLLYGLQKCACVALQKHGVWGQLGANRGHRRAELSLEYHDNNGTTSLLLERIHNVSEAEGFYKDSEQSDVR